MSVSSENGLHVPQQLFIDEWRHCLVTSERRRWTRTIHFKY